MKEIITTCLSNNLIIYEIYSRKDIVSILVNNGLSKSNIPNITSMTYNQWNKGMTNAHLNPIFEYVSRNQYRYLGKNYPYTGEIYNKQGGVLIKIGYWLDGNLFDFNDQLSNYKFDIDTLSKETNFEGDTITYLKSLGFEESGRYFQKNGKIGVTKIPRERVSLVYAFVVNGRICYFGKTVQGFSRPFNYHKYTEMKSVTNGIKENVFNNSEVLIFTKRFEKEDFITWKNLSLNIIEAVEQALILKFLPEWNKYRHK